MEQGRVGGRSKSQDCWLREWGSQREKIKDDRAELNKLIKAIEEREESR